MPDEDLGGDGGVDKAGDEDRLDEDADDDEDDDEDADDEDRSVRDEEWDVLMRLQEAKRLLLQVTEWQLNVQLRDFRQGGASRSARVRGGASRSARVRAGRVDPYVTIRDDLRAVKRHAAMLLRQFRISWHGRQGYEHARDEDLRPLGPEADSFESWAEAEEAKEAERAEREARWRFIETETDAEALVRLRSESPAPESLEGHILAQLEVEAQLEAQLAAQRPVAGVRNPGPDFDELMAEAEVKSDSADAGGVDVEPERPTWDWSHLLEEP